MWERCVGQGGRSTGGCWWRELMPRVTASAPAMLTHSTTIAPRGWRSHVIQQHTSYAALVRHGFCSETIRHVPYGVADTTYVTSRGTEGQHHWSELPPCTGTHSRDVYTRRLLAWHRERDTHTHTPLSMMLIVKTRA